jgi:hypothetical protein
MDGVTPLAARAYPVCKRRQWRRDLNREGCAMRKWNWLAVLVVAALSLGTVWAESRSCNPPICCPDACVPNTCAK